MKLQRFVGKNTQSVLDEIRSILGEEALIVSNTKVGSKTEIIAASEALKIDSQSNSSDQPQSKRAPEHEDSFASVMESQREKEAETQAPDPWAHIKSINDEIRSIKSSLNQLPIVNPRADQNISKEYNQEDQEITREDPLQILTKTSEGCHIVWGERKSGKTYLIKELMKRRADNQDATSIFRLPHKNSNTDSHLSAIAEKYSVNLFLLNRPECVESMINLLGSEHLIFVEADLSMLASLATKKDISWLANSSNYIIDEDEKQTELVAKLFEKLDAAPPTAVSSEIIEKIS